MNYLISTGEGRQTGQPKQNPFLIYNSAMDSWDNRKTIQHKLSFPRVDLATSWRLRSRGGLRLLLHMHAKSVAVLESLKAKLQIYVWVLPPHFKISGSVTYHRHDLGFGWWKKCWWSLKIWALHQMVFSLENLFIDVKAVAVYLLWEARWIK